LRKSSAPVFLAGVEEEILNIGEVPCLDPAIFIFFLGGGG
jgi:hypothetical protein